jgi:hypothetical protein
MIPPSGVSSAQARREIMLRCKSAAPIIGTILLSTGLFGCGVAGEQASQARPMNENVITPASMTRVGSVDERYQSYNVEMLEVTGGKFWKPYGPELEAILKAGQSASAPSRASSSDTPAGMDPRLYEYRPPIDLGRPRLRKLAAALGPAYVRVSGTWANTTYFADSDPPPSTPPPGFMGVLSRQQWKGVIDFAKAVNAEIVTSFAIGAGTRDRAGLWTDIHARRWVEYTKSIGGALAAAEFMNEPNLATMGGAPAGYDASAYGRDFKVFRAFADRTLPDMVVLGPGSVGETTGNWRIMYGTVPVLATRDLLVASQPATVDAFSYHFYGATSIRCTSTGMPTTAEAALSEAWLRRTDETFAFYKALRDEFAPGKPFWLTETGEAACGGNPWANTFVDTFRYLDQLGRLARHGVRVVMHNTLAASDYSLLDEKSAFEPKPNYWAALLWRKLMGPVVLDPAVASQPGLHMYAHCLRDNPGGVALLAINTDRNASHTLTVPGGTRYTLSSAGANLQARQVRLNGSTLALAANDDLPALNGDAITAGSLSLTPATITFVAFPNAANSACR